MSKLRILCLHGFTSNGAVHAHQIRRVVKALPEFEFLFPDGPHQVDIATEMDLSTPSSRAWSDYVSETSTSGHRAWWFAREAHNGQLGGFIGIEESLDHISSIIQLTGPVHAIWGFSQGGCFAGMLMSLLSESLQDHPLKAHLPQQQSMPSAGIFISGFKARFPQYDSAYHYGIQVPNLHIIGENDTAVSAERSETLIGLCRNPTVLRHSGGHNIPASEVDKRTIVQFLKSNVRSKPTESVEPAML